MGLIHGGYLWGLFMGTLIPICALFFYACCVCGLGVYVCLYVHCYGPIKGFVMLCCYSYDFGVFICCVITVMRLCWGTYNHWGKGEGSWT